MAESPSTDTAAEEASLGSITIRKQTPKPQGEVEVTPENGRIHFKNLDKKSYRLRFFREHTEPSTGIDMLLPAASSLTVLIKRHDAWGYILFHVGTALNGIGGGPIK